MSTANQTKDAPRFKRWNVNTPGLDFFASIGAGFLVLWILRMYTYANDPLDSTAFSILLFLKVSLLFPFLEEYLFRGVLQGALAKRDWGRKRFFRIISSANLITSLLFMTCHFAYHPPLWAASVFFPSLLFGYFKDRYTTIVYSALLHMIFNAGYYILFIY